MKDGDKVSAALEAILGPHIKSKANFVFVRERDFYESCKLTSMTKRRFTEEVQDALTGSKFCNKYGEWVYTEYGDGYTVFVRLSYSGAESVRKTIDRLCEVGTGSVHEFAFDKAKDLDIGFSVGDAVENTKSGNSGVVIAIKNGMLVVRADDKTFRETERSEFLMGPSEVELLTK